VALFFIVLSPDVNQSRINNKNKIFKKNYFSAIKLAFRTVFAQFQASLIQRETALQYDLQQSLGDQNYYLSVTLPALICKLE
jgi:hypothetical protein